MRLLLAAALMAASVAHAEPKTDADATPWSDAQDQGVKTCADAVKTVFDNVIEDDPYAYNSSWNPTDPDGSIYNVVLSQQKSEGELVGVLNAVRNRRGGCDVVIVQTVTTELPCASIRDSTFKNWMSVETLSKTVMLQHKDDGSLYALLTPQSNGGCLVNRQDLYYDLR